MNVRVTFANRSSRIGIAIVAGALVVLAAAPLWGGRQDLRLLAEIYAYVALASLWNLLAGYAGLVSVGQQAYVGLGGYLLFAFAVLAGISPLWAIPLAKAPIVSIRRAFCKLACRRCFSCSRTILLTALAMASNAMRKRANSAH